MPRMVSPSSAFLAGTMRTPASGCAARNDLIPPASSISLDFAARMLSACPNSARLIPVMKVTAAMPRLANSASSRRKVGSLVRRSFKSRRPFMKPKINWGMCWSKAPRLS